MNVDPRTLPLYDFATALAACNLAPLRPAQLEVLQLNLGRLCNQSCRHCHVEAGPDRTEIMSREVMDACLRALAGSPIATVDLTGGAPELNPGFRWLVERCHELGRHVIDRCNLTVLTTRRGQDLPAFLATHEVELVCSLPHYRALITDRQRGAGVFEHSIAALHRLNQAGYGHGDPRRRLVLATNPGGAFLPGAQAALEREWRRELAGTHDVHFDALYTMTNLPIGRFRGWLEQTGNLRGYMRRLAAAFNPEAARATMCRFTLSVAWEGTLYDCDFNQMLALPMAPGAPHHIRDFDLGRLEERAIQIGPHCFGCTAGAGSSCGGATA